MQQTIPGQVSGADQPQEEVQLTELLPVKQSRIRENNIFKDADATDALKALRSFSDTCNEDQEYELRVFGYSREIASQKAGSNKRKIAKKTETKEKKKRGGEECVAREKNTNIKKKLIKPNKKHSREKGKSDNQIVTGEAKYSYESSLNVDEDANTEVGKDVDGDVDMDVEVDEDVNEDEDIDEEEDDDEQPSYLDLDKGKDGLNDEIYVFRREPLDSRLTPDTDQQEEDQSSENPDDYYENYSTTDGPLFEHASQADRAKKKKNDAELNTESTDSSKATENSEKELRLKIDAIIQANFLLERENNNVMHPDTIIPDSAEVPASTRQGCQISQLNAKKKSVSSGEKKNGVEGQDEMSLKKYCCLICEARFKGSGGLRNHYKVVHGAGPVYKCDECGKEFPLKERLKLHVRTHTGFKPYKCPECDKCFARGGQLVQHRRTHSQVKPYHCVICSGTFTCAANLALHVKRHNGQKDHKCEICGRGFVRRDALKKHLECLHRDVKSFLCVICNKTFKGHLPQHMRTHARDRPHGCATCGQRFAQKSQLTVHQRTHSGQRPFRCLVCWQAFAHSTALKLHTRRHTGERPFKCVECNAGFTQLPHWKKHMKCIHGRNEPYGCRRCNSFFRIKNDLESHEKTCHPDVEQPDADSNSAAAAASSNNDLPEKGQAPIKYQVMSVEKMRLLLAVLLKRISKQERLDELGFGKRLIDEVLQDSLISAGKDPVATEGLSELEALTRNLEIFLEWTVPKEHWDNFRKMKKAPEEILETLTAT